LTQNRTKRGKSGCFAVVQNYSDQQDYGVKGSQFDDGKSNFKLAIKNDRRGKVAPKWNSGTRTKRLARAGVQTRNHRVKFKPGQGREAPKNMELPWD
jgi:hypothetical protein